MFWRSSWSSRMVRTVVASMASFRSDSDYHCFKMTRWEYFVKVICFDKLSNCTNLLFRINENSPPEQTVPLLNHEVALVILEPLTQLFPPLQDLLIVSMTLPALFLMLILICALTSLWRLYRNLYQTKRSNRMFCSIWRLSILIPNCLWGPSAIFCCNWTKCTTIWSNLLSEIRRRFSSFSAVL